MKMHKESIVHPQPPAIKNNKAMDLHQNQKPSVSGDFCHYTTDNNWVQLYIDEITSRNDNIKLQIAYIMFDTYQIFHKSDDKLDDLPFECVSVPGNCVPNNFPLVSAESEEFPSYISNMSYTTAATERTISAVHQSHDLYKAFT